MKSFYILLLTLVSISSYGQTTPVFGPPPPPTPVPTPPPPTISLKTGTIRLRNLLADHVTTLDRPLVTFHYEAGPTTATGSTVVPGQWKFKPKSQDEVIQHVLPDALRFYDPSPIFTGDTEGPGEYVSSDPNGSRNFGGLNPKLFVITLKQGSIILDIRSWEFMREPTGRNLWKAMGCGAGLMSWGLGVFRNSQTELCRQAAINALKLLKIQAILYDYSSVNSLSGCRVTRNEALNIISPDIIDTSSLAFFSNDMKIENDQLGIYTAALFKEGLHDYERRIGSEPYDDVPPLSLKNLPSPNPAKYEHWKEKYIYKCGKLRRSETLEGDPLSELMRKSLTSQDLLKLQMKVSRAFKKRNINEAYYSFRNIRAIELRLYAASHMADDMSKFTQWHEGTLAANGWGEKYSEMSTAQRVEVAANLFEEKSTLNIGEMTESEMAKKFYAEIMQKSPSDVVEALFSTYLKYGFSKRVVTAMVDSTLMYSGGAPFLIDELTTGPNTNYSELMERNRQEAMVILNHCLALYKNPKISNKEIQNGECAIVNDKY